MDIPGPRGEHTRYAQTFNRIGVRANIPQGPFPSDTMQNWHGQHYFPDDLPMKRVDIDSTWMTLVDVKLRATGDRIFLCPLRDLVPPPGLPRHPVDTQLYGRTRQFLQDQGTVTFGVCGWHSHKFQALLYQRLRYLLWEVDLGDPTDHQIQLSLGINSLTSHILQTRV